MTERMSAGSSKGTAPGVDRPASDPAHGPGDPGAGYHAATERVALVDAPSREILPVGGRSPAKMLVGMVTGPIPPDLEEVEPGIRRGALPYSAMLTPKGRVVTDLRVGRLEDGEGGRLFLDLPVAGLDSAREHISKYLPPRFAKVEDPDEPIGTLTVVGPDAASLLSREALGLRVDAAVLDGLSEGEERVLDDGSTFGIRVVRNGDVLPPAFDLIGSSATLSSLEDRLRELEVVHAGPGVWETLRLEKGRPAYGSEFHDETLLPETGIQERCVDSSKGCYTGQEVVVRVRDRGRVNRHLRGLLLGDAPLPTPGTPLFHPERDRPSGEIRSVARSPRFGGGIALAYVRREVEPPDNVRVGAPDGPEAGVRTLDDDGWLLVEGDPGS